MKTHGSKRGALPASATKRNQHPQIHTANNRCRRPVTCTLSDTKSFTLKVQRISSHHNLKRH